jgi:hypothetical protein
VVLVGVILDADEVERGFVGRSHHLADAIESLGRRHERDAELDGHERR